MRVRNFIAAMAAIVTVTVGVIIIMVNSAPVSEPTLLDCSQEDYCTADYMPESDGTGAWYISHRDRPNEWVKVTR